MHDFRSEQTNSVTAGTAFASIRRRTREYGESLHLRLCCSGNTLCEPDSAYVNHPIKVTVH